MKFKLNLNKILIIAGSAAVITLVAFFIWWNSENSFIINNGDIGSDNISGDLGTRSSISGISCNTYSRRPIAIMLSGDPETRPLSGISEADMIFEMPVTPSGINRFMAVFQCGEPTEVGSIRSAREDFIPLAAGFNAIYAHWGGEREALAKLDGHVIDNIDGLKFDGTVFYRKKGVPMPHNGFTNLDRLTEQAKKFKYSLENKFTGYKHEDKEQVKSLNNIAEEIIVDYPSPYNVKWIYDSASAKYKRLRSDKPETDRNTSEQIWVKTVIVLKTGWKYQSKDYMRVDTQGSGEIMVYQGGVVQSGRWEKSASSLDSKLYFYDNDGKEIVFLPGNKWVEIVVN